MNNIRFLVSKMTLRLLEIFISSIKSFHGVLLIEYRTVAKNLCKGGLIYFTVAREKIRLVD